MVIGLKITYMQSVPITTKVVSLNPVHGDRAGVRDTTFMRLSLSVTSDRSLGTPVSLTNKTDNHDITEILLKVVLYTITLVFFTHLRPDFGQVVYT